MAAIGILLFVFIWRRLWRELPFFFLYLSSVMVFGVGRYLSYRFQDQHHYFYVYWISDIAGSLIALFPMYEVFFKRAFARFYRTYFYRVVFPSAALLVLILTVVSALAAKDQRSAFQTASQAFDFMRTAVLVFFMSLMVFMGRDWTRYDLGITLGFAIQAAISLADAAVKLKIHYQPSVLNTIEVVAYNISCVIWLIAFAMPERSTAPFEQIDRDVLNRAQSWESMLKAWLSPGSARRNRPQQ
jgi:hypothetical protein